MKKINLEKTSLYLKNNARPVDYALFEYHFQSGSPEKVLDEIAAFQNEDGGFGKALEPDLRLPKSTPLATCMAFQIIKEIDANETNEVVKRALEYLVNTCDPDRKGWPIVAPEVDKHPHAPWWTYRAAMGHFGWGNPSAEILGFLILYNVEGVEEMVTSLKEMALKRLGEMDPESFHEVFNFKALYEMADSDLQEELRKPLADLIKGAASTNPDEWAGYVATPLKFVHSPEDPFVDLFEAKLLEKNLDFLAGQIVEGDHWEPNWDWSGNYPEVWEQAKVEWSGRLTVQNLQLLKNFGRIG